MKQALGEEVEGWQGRRRRRRAESCQLVPGCGRGAGFSVTTHPEGPLAFTPVLLLSYVQVKPSPLFQWMWLEPMSECPGRTHMRSLGFFGLSPLALKSCSCACALQVPAVWVSLQSATKSASNYFLSFCYSSLADFLPVSLWPSSL